jgi:hypothetical protein
MPIHLKALNQNPAIRVDIDAANLVRDLGFEPDD